MSVGRGAIRFNASKFNLDYQIDYWTLVCIALNKEGCNFF